MNEKNIDLQEYGGIKAIVIETREIVKDLQVRGSRVAWENRINLRWVWAAVCGLATLFGAGFLFLFNCGGAE
jgi:hypothetical protein